MKSSQPAESAAPTNYAPSVPMSVYRELAAELRTNKAVIDSLNSRNQQLTQQNQFLKQEIHNVVQATLNLGQAAGVARQAAQEAGSQGFPNAVAPDTLAKLVRAEAAAQNQVAQHDAMPSPQALGYEPPSDRQQRRPVAATQPIQAKSPQPRAPQSPSAVPATTHNRVPRPIEQNPAQAASNAKRKVVKQSGSKQSGSKQSGSSKQFGSKQPRQQAQKQTQKQLKQQANRPVHPTAFRPTETIPGKGTLTQGAMKPTGSKAGKLFTEQSGEYRSSVLDSQDSKEIGGIWLALSIILIIVTAFGAGFLIMKPLLNDR